MADGKPARPPESPRPTDRTPARWTRALLNTCLLAWPKADRRAIGAGLVVAALDALSDADGRSGAVREVLAEAGAVIVGGLDRRRERLAATTRDNVSGWTGDARFALRSLRRSPGFTTVVVCTLALGIGANAAVFSLVDAVLLQAPPYPRPDELVAVWNSLPDSHERVPIAGPDAAVLAERSERLERSAFTIRGVDGALQARGGSETRHVRLASVTSDFFQVLGIEPALGRTFETDDATAGGPDLETPLAVVLAHRLWTSAFGADPGILGSEIRLNGWPVTVVGVMPSDFSLPLPPEAGIVTDVDVWLPLTVPLTDFHRAEDRLLDRDSDNTGVVIARLSADATIAQARTELNRIAADLRDEVPAYAAAGLGFDVRPLLRDATAHARPVLLALLGGVFVLLLVVCLNIATLVMARGLDRTAEFAVRLALGSGRPRIVRQLLVENGVLALSGLAGALLVAAIATPALSSIVPPTLSPVGRVTLDVGTMAFAALLAMGAVLLFGSAPAAHIAAYEERGALGAGIRRDTVAGVRRRRRLVAAQVALSVALSVGAGLLSRAVYELNETRPGFDAQGALTFRISLRVPDAYRSPAYRAELMKSIETRLGDLPEVRAVGLVGVLPLGGDRWSQPYGLPGQSQTEWRENRADFQMISSGYFEAIGARLREGRSFTAHEDLNEDERVVVVDEKLGARVAPEGSALGRVIGVPVDGSPVEARIVGVVEHIRHERLDADGREAVYVPYRQEASRDVTFVLRTSGDPGALAPAVRRAVREVDSRIPVYELRTLEDYVDEATAPRRFALSLLLGFAALTLLSAALGLYGAMAFEVSRRTREIGLRIAVGASRRNVVTRIVVNGIRVGATGLAGGVVLGLLAARGMGGLLADVGIADPLTWSAVLGLVGLVTVAASWIPASKASRLSPTVALRSD